MFTVKHFLVASLFVAQTVRAQEVTSIDSLFTYPTNSAVITLSNFYSLILQDHPVALQAQQLSDIAQQEIRLARGNFDPKIETTYSTKHSNSSTYYSKFDGAIKFPTRIPLDPVIGMEQNTGPYLNPEEFVGGDLDGRQFYTGISLPLGRGLITDERRTALQQAELFRKMTEADQVKLVNKLLLEAAKDYWQWYYAYHNYQLLRKSVDLAENILDRVRANYQFGEAAKTDTLQARITWQQRIIEQQEAFLDLQNSQIKISSYLWDSLRNPVDLDIRSTPVLLNAPWSLTASSLEELSSMARANHPDLRKLEVKLKQLNVERKLAAENLKPQLDMNFYILNKPFDPEWNTSFGPIENYKVSAELSFPIFLRKERAKLALTKLKQSNTTYELTLAERGVINELQNTYNNLINLQSIVTSQREMVQSYERLLEAELLNLAEGESDLFKLNIQQEKLILGQAKWLKMISEFEKQKAVLYWAAGVKNLTMPL